MAGSRREVALMRITVKMVLGVCCLLGIYWIAQSRSVLDALALSLCAGGLGVDSL